MGWTARFLPMTLVLGACVSGPQRGAPPVRIDRQSSASAPLHTPTGLEMVMGRNARALIAAFGNPDLDVREGTARKLQFLGSVCVLDAYLYPPRRGGDPVVTHVDARLPDGRDTDRAACAESLSRR